MLKLYHCAIGKTKMKEQKNSQDDGGGKSAKRKIKPSVALAIGGIALAGVFVAIAIFSPGSLDRFLHPGDERSARIKTEMERQKGSDPDRQSDDGLKQEEKTKSAAITPTPLPEETAPAVDGNTQEYTRIPRPECISQDQVVKTIGASEEARDGRVVEISGASYGGGILVAYRKKTFLGIGSGENQIEGILRRGLRTRFPDRFIKSLKVRSAGTRFVQRGDQNIKVEVLEIETLQAGCRWP
jgi:hypothetical protein